jgi:hypothetical protein
MGLPNPRVLPRLPGACQAFAHLLGHALLGVEFVDETDDGCEQVAGEAKTPEE